jgi:hypothetical protein
MKKPLLIGVGVLVVLMLLFVGFYQFTTSKSPRTKLDAQGPAGLMLHIDHGTPSLRGRVAFGPAGSGSIEPYNKVWRTGANEATRFVINKDVKVGDKVVKAGSYTLYTIPNAEKWTVIINGQTGQWGTTYNEDRDVARLEVPVEKLDAPVEKLTITATADEATKTAAVALMWDKTKIKFDLVVQ